jgi:tetratricopeptide (TPR) repeat protein
MVGGSYGSAIATLRQAVAASDPASLTHAYALFDLGRSLRLAGNPQAAIPILEQRLQIPNQTGIVRQELALAMQAALGAGSSAGGAGPPADKAHGNGKHKHGGGGD